MATITLAIPNSVATRVTNALCARGGYQETVVNPDDPTAMIPNPVTKPVFAQRRLAAWIKAEVREHEGVAASEGAMRQAMDAVDREIVIT